MNYKPGEHDYRLKGRFRAGTTERNRDIIKKHGNGESLIELAKEYELKIPTVRQIVNKVKPNNNTGGLGNCPTVDITVNTNYYHYPTHRWNPFEH